MSFHKNRRYAYSMFIGTAMNCSRKALIFKKVENIVATKPDENMSVMLKRGSKVFILCKLLLFTEIIIN